MTMHFKLIHPFRVSQNKFRALKLNTLQYTLEFYHKNLEPKHFSKMNCKIPKSLKF